MALAAMSTGNDAQVLDAKTWTVVHNVSGLGIHSLSWDPTGPHLVTGSAEVTHRSGQSRVANEFAISAIRRGGRCSAFSPDGRLVVVGSRDGTVQVWDAMSATLRSQSNHLRSDVLSVEFDRTLRVDCGV